MSTLGLPLQFGRYGPSLHGYQALQIAYDTLIPLSLWTVIPSGKKDTYRIRVFVLLYIRVGKTSSHIRFSTVMNEVANLPSALFVAKTILGSNFCLPFLRFVFIELSIILDSCSWISYVIQTRKVTYIKEDPPCRLYCLDHLYKISADW